MVSLINHEYSRREAHGRFAWQFMLSNVEAEKPRLGSVASRDVGLSQAGVSLTG
jgi:hypothetical protein